MRGTATLMGAFLDAASGTHYMSRMFHVSFAGVGVPLHWFLVGAALGCLTIGAIVARRRPSQPGRRASIPAAALILAFFFPQSRLRHSSRSPSSFLILAYVAVFGLVVENAYYSHLSSFDFMDGLDWQYLVRPVVLLLIYCLFRAVNCRFSRVRQSGPMTFLATLRYGSALDRHAGPRPTRQGSIGDPQRSPLASCHPTRQPSGPICLLTLHAPRCKLRSCARKGTFSVPARVCELAAEEWL